MRGLRICFVCDEYPPLQHGGIGRGIQILARSLVEAGHTVRVIGMQHPSYSGPAFERDQGVQVHRFAAPHRDLAGIRSRIGLYKTVAAWARRGEIDLIEVPDGGGACAGWPRLPVPVITRIHGSCTYFAIELGRQLPRVTYRLERASLQRSDYWYSVSRYAADRTQQIFHSGPADAVIHITSINPRAACLPRGFVAQDRSNNEVVFTGTLTAKKGIFSLLKAWAAVRKGCTHAQLHIFGKDLGRPRPTAEILLDLLPQEERSSVHFHGHASAEQLGDALRRARVAIFPSYSEAFALAPIEAMANACPTIYSWRSSGPELITHGQDGWLIEPDSPGQISEAVLAFLHNDQLAERLGTAGQQRVLHHLTIDQILPKVVQFYSDSLFQFHKNGVFENPRMINPSAVRTASGKSTARSPSAIPVRTPLGSR